MSASPFSTAWLVEAPTSHQFNARAIETVVSYKRTPFQEMYIVDTRELGRALVLDGKWQSCVSDEFIYHEALVQPAMLLANHPNRVLILGGAEGATVREVCRWSQTRAIVMVDIDADVVASCREHLAEMHAQSFDDNRVQVVIADAFKFLLEDVTEWDVIIMDLSDPVLDGPSLQLFTTEAFRQILRRLNPSGILGVQGGPVLGNGFGVLIRTLEHIFTTVRPYSATVPTYPGPWGFIIATNGGPDFGDDESLTAKLNALSGRLQFLDVPTLRAMFVLGMHVRRKIAAARDISTAKSPVKFF